MVQIETPHLRWLLISLGLVLAPLVTQLVPWVPLFAFALGIWRYALARRQRPLPGMKLLVPLTAIFAMGILASYGGVFGRDAGVALLVLMTALKTMETRTRRDMALVVYLGYFLCVCVFLFSQAMPVALFMALPVTALTATLIGINQAGNGLSGMGRLKQAGWMLAQAAPVMIVMFLLFPRISGPLWGIPEDMARGQTGLAEDMSPGSISDLSHSDAVAFRTVFKGPIPPQSQLYWRGPVFWNYDGRTWRAGGTPSKLDRPAFRPLSAPVEYTVTLEPHNKLWLLVLDLPAKLPDTGILTADYQFLARQPVRQRVRYDAASVTAYREGEMLDDTARQRALQLPSYGNLRTRKMAEQWREENADPRALIHRALDMYRNEFIYTLSPPPLGMSSVDGFLFDTKKGFCEHFAGSFVFLMRAAGVPARVVTGYQGGQPNPMGDYIIVRQSDAHAWAEVWLQGQGWVRIDPTAAVAPQRIQRGIAAAVPLTDPLPTMARPGFNWMKRLNLGWDVLNNGWNQWVLGYNQQRQLDFLSRLTGSHVEWGNLALWMVWAVSAIVCITAAFLLSNPARQADPVQRAWLRFRKKLARAGVTALPYEGPRDFARRAARQLPLLGPQIERIAILYLELHYGGREDAAELQNRVKAFRP